jgi:anti-sigma B factor antagonist
VKEFQIQLEDIKPGMTIMHVSGWLDAHTFVFLEQHLQQLFKDGKIRIAINLAEVEYISSAGAGVFIGTLSESRSKGGNVVLMNPTEPVREVFDMLGLSQVFKFAATPEIAEKLLEEEET